MITINLNFPLLGLDGQEVPMQRLGQLLGAHLMSQAQGDAIKYYDWAVDLYKGNPIVVDNSDFNRIKKFVEESSTLFLLSKAQILRKMEEAEKESEKV